MNNLPVKNTASLLKGFSFVFKDGKNSIVAGASSATGKEYIYVNEKLFSEKRSVNIISEHELEYGENKYKIIFNVKSVLTGKIECSLFVNGTLIKIYRVSFIFRIVKFIFSLIIGGLCGIIGAYLGMSFWAIAPFALLMICIFIVLFKPSKDFCFEDETA